MVTLSQQAALLAAATPDAASLLGPLVIPT